MQFTARPDNVIVDLNRTACIVIDMQNDFCTEGGWLDSIGVDVSPLQEPIPRLATLLPALRDIGAPIIHLNWGNRPDRANLPPEILHVYDPDGSGVGIGDALPNGARVLEKGSWSAATVDQLAIVETDIRVDKYRMTGFVDTELDSILRNLDVTTLLFTGVNLDQCVLATLMDATALGYDCILLEDCCATTSPPACVEATIYNVAQCFGFVSSSTEFLQGLDRMSTERFEVVSASSHVAHRISPGDTVKFVVLRRPEHAGDASVFVEIWDEGGSQPPNSHSRSVETFYVLHGRALAHCDGSSFPLASHQFLVLQPGSLHYIENVGDDRMYAITTMSPDEGFARIVENGPTESLDDFDRAMLNELTSKVPQT
jgi:nicotinamidase-related amidase/quercetin dioxygenase-like cupin family protein